jgi:hypothetical protein
MTDGKNNSNKSPKHISEIIKEAKKTWLKQRVDIYMNSDEFKETLDQAKHIQLMFIYIDGDPQYIRTIYLN